MIARQGQPEWPFWLEEKRSDGAPARHFRTQERRLRERISDADLAVTFKGDTHRAANWSLGGFVIEDYRGSLSPGALFCIDAVGKPGGEMTKVTVRARVVRADRAKRSLAVSFLDLDGRAYGVLHEVMSDRMRLVKEQSFT
jgi:hypothetical protein